MAFYRQPGWYISKPLFAEEEIDEIAAAVDRFYEGHRDGDAPVEVEPFLAWKSEYGQDIIRMNDHVVFQSSVIRRLALDPIIGAVAARLAHGLQSVVHRPTRSVTLRDLPERFLVGRYHSLQIVESTLPTDFPATAWSDDGTVMCVEHR